MRDSLHVEALSVDRRFAIAQRAWEDACNTFGGLLAPRLSTAEAVALASEPRRTA